jgi:hypothetical protein
MNDRLRISAMFENQNTPQSPLLVRRVSLNIGEFGSGNFDGQSMHNFANLSRRFIRRRAKFRRSVDRFMPNFGLGVYHWKI